MTTRRPSGDEGSVMLLVMGFTAVLAALVVLVADVSVLLLAQRGVASAADGAAVAAAQELDEGAFHRDGPGDVVPLDPSLVRVTVASYARTVTPRTLLVGDVAADGTTVRVRASRLVPLPFGRYAGIGAVTVTSEASARAPVGPG